MIELRAVDHGVLLAVRAQPGARANALRGEHQGRLRVAVTAAPEKGKANKAICELVAKQLKLRKSQVQLAAGATTSDKRLLVTEITLEELRRRLDTALGE